MADVAESSGSLSLSVTVFVPLPDLDEDEPREHPCGDEHEQQPEREVARMPREDDHL
jgi:hypothetical protein